MSNAGLSERIKNCRLKLGKSQEDFGKMFDPVAPKSAVSRWEHGGGPNKGRLKKIAELCDTTVEELVGSSPMLTEKQKSCPYCHVFHDKSSLPIFDGELVNDKSGRKIEITVIKDPDLPIFAAGLENTNYSTEYDSSTPRVNYCPMCGRPLNEEAK